METVDVMIRIPKKQLESLQKIANGTWGLMNLNSTEIAILNGTVLPKGHTDLIDRQALIHSIEQKAKRLSNLDTINGLCGAVAIVFDAPTIIEADNDKEGSK